MEELSLDDELSILVHEIEHRKASVRIEWDNLKNDYLNGDYRRWGTKREVEDRLSKMTGQILGFESALSVLYKRMSRVDG